MLKKIYRIPSSQKLKNTSFSRTPYFKLMVSSNDLPINRFGFTVKKSADKRAVARNRAKRVLRSCIEEMLPNIKSGHDMLFMLEKGIIGKERNVVFGEIKKILSERKLLN